MSQTLQFKDDAIALSDTYRIFVDELKKINYDENEIPVFRQTRTRIDALHQGVDILVKDVGDTASKLDSIQTSLNNLSTKGKCIVGHEHRQELAQHAWNFSSANPAANLAPYVGLYWTDTEQMFDPHGAYKACGQAKTQTECENAVGKDNVARCTWTTFI